MRRLFVKLSVYLLALALLLVALYFTTGWVTRNHRLGTAQMKHQRLADLPGRKAILIGGSNLHYGINSELLEQQIGMPVVNMGIQGSIGMDYYFNEIMDEVDPTDVVIFLAEPYHITGFNRDGEQPLYTMLSKYPQGLRYLTKAQWWNMPKYFTVAIQENIKYIISLTTFKLRGKQTIAEQTNPKGDYEGHRGKASKLKTGKGNVDFYAADGVEANIRQTTAYLLEKEAAINAKGAYFFIGYAPTAQSAAHQEVFQLVNDVVAGAFPNHLGELADYILPDDHFYDSSHHLLHNKRDLRTQMVFDAIRNNGKNNAIIFGKNH